MGGWGWVLLLHEYFSRSRRSKIAEKISRNPDRDVYTFRRKYTAYFEENHFKISFLFNYWFLVCKSVRGVVGSTVDFSKREKYSPITTFTQDMSSRPKAIDLTKSSDSQESQPDTKKRKRNRTTKPSTTRLTKVWLLIHQLESGGYHCVGDYSEYGALSHKPETFDTKVLGIFVDKEKANTAARAACERLGIERGDSYNHDDDDEQDEEQDEEDEDFEGEGRFESGEESGSANVFSQRVFIMKKSITY